MLPGFLPSGQSLFVPFLSFHPSFTYVLLFSLLNLKPTGIGFRFDVACYLTLIYRALTSDQDSGGEISITFIAFIELDADQGHTHNAPPSPSLKALSLCQKHSRWQLTRSVSPRPTFQFLSPHNYVWRWGARSRLQHIVSYPSNMPQVVEVVMSRIPYREWSSESVDPESEWIEETELLVYSYFISAGAIHCYLRLLVADMGNAGLRNVLKTRGGEMD